MALIDCPECGNQVYEKAEACPKCGYPIAENRHETWGERYERMKREEREREQHYRQVFINAMNRNICQSVMGSTGSHCSVCGSNNIRRISTASRMASTMAFGIASSSIGKQFVCNKCGYKW